MEIPSDLYLDPHYNVMYATPKHCCRQHYEELKNKNLSNYRYSWTNLKESEENLSMRALTKANAVNCVPVITVQRITLCTYSGRFKYSGFVLAQRFSEIKYVNFFKPLLIIHPLLLEAILMSFLRKNSNLNLIFQNVMWIRASVD